MWIFACHTCNSNTLLSAGTTISQITDKLTDHMTKRLPGNLLYQPFPLLQSCCGRLPGNGYAVCNSRTLVLVCACVCRQAWLYSYINALASDHTACHKHSDSLPQSAVPPTSTTPIARSFSNNCSCNKRHQHQYRNGNETALHCIALAAATCCQLFVHYTFATTPKAQAKRLADGLTVSLAVKLYVQRIFAAA